MPPRHRITECKLVLLGDSNVGKSSLVLRFVKNQFNADQVTTVGAAFLQSPVPLDDSEDKIQFGIWDTAGSERYKALAPMYYRGAEAAIVVYDITSFESFGARPTRSLFSRAEASSPSFAAPPLPARPMLLD